MSKDTQQPRSPELRHRIMAGFIGNVVEWYDFAVYGYLAGVIAPVFFPAGSPTAALIGTYGIFAAGFIMRPLGAAVFGWFGDRYGRARTMQISVILMALPTLLLGLLPSYEQVGLLAPVLLVLIRLFQGLSVGGEFSSSATYLVETAPKGKRGITGSWANIGSMTGSLLGVAAAALVTNAFDTQTLDDWAWRLPFLGGAILGLSAILVRRNLHNSERFTQHHELRDETSPLLQAFTTNRYETLLALAFASSYGTCYYLVFVYLPEWLAAEQLMARSTALLINTAMMILVIPAMPLFAVVGDRYMRRRTWIALSLLLLALLGWPLHVWMLDSGGSLTAVIASHALVFLLLAVPLGSAPALFVELFPESDRLSGYSVAFNLGLGVFGGLTPMIATALIATTGILTTPAMYLALTAFIAVLALMMMPDRSREPLR
ncbi:MFS transporter [Marinobacter persicus]|jgi:MHS family proline/betaine transporter-like MFS transporter|uniref:MHS family proline/betaine transporter-like MFS transporter n=1 Tax=Marinobacter persicus TaxID=930118 RepID=A0A2S6G4E1_9GAMM|nr:MFS transporter [Marinobacter persicus]PPK50594.1 MHS family proline/betaine transporter-like MFS transporter [Marinobacter persicus]PPK53869.1 MHS family proline/betaine transporter-like MFS transporter [Marinobacter persicus]PPK57105.1 MHS family proline/betaine transporter-like MFS transporter [Marinobacter persicus]